MTDEQTSGSLSRRDVLRASGGVFGLSGATGNASPSFSLTGDCPDATTRPAMRDCEAATTAGCTDDHPRTKELSDEAAAALDADFDTVGALLDDGFVPYFDLLTDGDAGGWSHWLNPRYIGDDSILDASRPAAVMVDNKWWRPLGVMFVATRDGERLDDPPDVYGEGDDEDRCSPWHHHVGLPGRYAWWKYQQVWGDGADTGFRLPCRTPCMMHVWTLPNPGGVYAHGPPPRGSRGGPPAEPAGFETTATPGEDVLGVDVLAEELLNSSVAERSR
ncbi:hypothetical protein EGH21_10525 [Halomicroarcula sp. F13]|uniref:Secreted protein n=1 Tax=Haloarcula rubra TaxID=2487747 RepID=A0AAW4PR33_9EURY|nr:hypothetical protein [Halomicroarcula rubra]MBX0323463.1 hypothetical protein [Halomicroarcula rubra]